MTDPKQAVLRFILDGADPAREAETRHEFNARIWPQVASAKWFAAQSMTAPRIRAAQGVGR